MHATIFQPTAFQAGAATGDPVAERMRATWTTGDFGRIAVAFAFGAAEFVARLGLARGERGYSSLSTA